MTPIDDLLNKLAPETKAPLERLRRIIRATAPEAEEVISYGMPGFKYKGKYLAGFNAFKDHLSFFPAGTVEHFKDQLEGFTLSKGTIQFTIDHEIPEPVIKEIIAYRQRIIDSNEKEK